ncbi:ribonuclease E inhibitor RraB [Celeribacter sp. PS-C1]|uniref:ribonuclease E inhibitor RraB n=1 Tax=Celeribacter sp. PS-C1 TaxID=2820813 RepID=UPI001C6628EF|nr:ribonuclease E inhibitor RraB [Celeribacter sp. PS-C1]MBW6417361.1 ribonuclease E inhibitor RraB [Celeribacter sp. PS-C1]
MKNRIIELQERLYGVNESILKKFEQDGVTLFSEKEVGFFVEMPTKDDVFKAAASMRKVFKRAAFHGSVTHNEPQKIVYYRYDIVVPLTAGAIPQVEAELLSVCEQYGGDKSFWEFAG